MNRVLATCAFLAVVATGCGDDGEAGAIACDPALNGTAREPMPSGETTFRLKPQSDVRLPDGSREALTGSIVVAECLSLNTWYSGRIETVRMISKSLAVDSGCTALGTIVSSTLFYGDLSTSFSSSARTNGDVVVLHGYGPPYSRGRMEVNLVAGEYDFHVVALAESQTNATHPLPYCNDWGF